MQTPRRTYACQSCKTVPPTTCTCTQGGLHAHGVDLGGRWAAVAGRAARDEVAQLERLADLEPLQVVGGDDALMHGEGQEVQPDRSQVVPPFFILRALPSGAVLHDVLGPELIGDFVPFDRESEREGDLRMRRVRHMSRARQPTRCRATYTLYRQYSHDGQGLNCGLWQAGAVYAVKRYIGSQERSHAVPQGRSRRLKPWACQSSCRCSRSA